MLLIDHVVRHVTFSKNLPLFKELMAVLSDILKQTKNKRHKRALDADK